MGNQTPDSDAVCLLYYTNGLNRVVIIDCVFMRSHLLTVCSGSVMHYYGLLLLFTSDLIIFALIHISI